MYSIKRTGKHKLEKQSRNEKGCEVVGGRWDVALGTVDKSILQSVCTEGYIGGYYVIVTVAYCH